MAGKSYLSHTIRKSVWKKQHSTPRRKRIWTMKGGDRLTEKIEESRRTNNLDVSNMNLTSIPDIPDSVTHLFCSRNKLTCLPKLPPALVTLACEYNRLTSLPELPDSVSYIFCNGNQLTSLPKLPLQGKILLCSNNLLTSLPQLPLCTRLECDGNQLTSLPDLPPTLIQLYCGANQLTSLPDLPDSLRSFLCYGNPFTEPFLRTTKPIQAIRDYQRKKRNLQRLGHHLRGIKTLDGKLPTNVVGYMGTFVSGNTRNINTQMKEAKAQFTETALIP